MKFNEKLKALREAKGFTQDDIASKLNISRQSVSKWELGINEPDFKTAKELCKIFDCSLNELIDDDEEIVTTEDKKRERSARWIFLTNIILMIIAMLMVFALIAVSQNKIIIHWNRNGTISYGSRWYLLVGGLLSSFMGLVMAIAMRFICKKIEQYHRYKLVLQIVALVTSVVLVAALFVVSAFMIKDFIRGDAYVMNLIVTSLFALLVGVSPFTHPFFNRRNPMFGFRTNYTLSSEEAWKKVNTISSISLTIFGAIGYTLTLILIDKSFTVYFSTILVVGVVPPLIYHEVLRKKENQ